MSQLQFYVSRMFLINVGILHQTADFVKAGNMPVFS